LNCGYLLLSLKFQSSISNCVIFPRTSPSNGTFSGRNGVKVSNFLSLGSLTSLAPHFLGGNYGGITEEIFAPSISIWRISTSSSLSWIFSGSSCYTGLFAFSLGFLSCLVFFHYYFFAFFLGDILSSTQETSAGIFSTLLLGCSFVTTCFYGNLARLGDRSTFGAS